MTCPVLPGSERRTGTGKTITETALRITLKDLVVAKKSSSRWFLEWLSGGGLRAADRFRDWPDKRGSNFGFRIAKE